MTQMRTKSYEHRSKLNKPWSTDLYISWTIKLLKTSIYTDDTVWSNYDWKKIELCNSYVMQKAHYSVVAIFKRKLKNLNYLCSKILDQQAVIIWEMNAGLKGNNIDTSLPWKLNHSKVNSRHLQDVKSKLNQYTKNIGLSNLKIPKYMIKHKKVT